MNLIHSTRAIFCNEESMRSSFNINDQGELSIYEDHLFYKGSESEISIEKSRMETVEIVNKTPGTFEFIQIIVVNLIIVSGYLSYPYKNPLLFISLIAVSNAILYFPVFKEKWLKIIYIEAGEKKSVYFKPLGVLNLFSSWGFNTNDCQVMMYKLLK